MRFVKYFTFFRLSFRLLFCLIIYFNFAFFLHLLAFVLHQNCGEKAENADLKSQNRWIIGQKCGKSEKCLFSHFVQIMGDKECESGVLGAEVGETGKENAFFVQLEKFTH